MDKISVTIEAEDILLAIKNESCPIEKALAPIFEYVYVEKDMICLVDHDLNYHEIDLNKDVMMWIDDYDNNECVYPLILHIISEGSVLMLKHEYVMHKEDEDCAF